MRLLISILVLAALFAVTPALAQKNIILFIGDGMGPQQIGLLNLYQIHRGAADESALLSILGRSDLRLVQPRPQGALVIDSACSATELASGEPTRSEVIGINAEGRSVRSIVELASQLGKSTGLVSDTRITHATPAAFYAHVTHRSDENTIAEQLLSTSVDLALSGGVRHFIPQGARGPAGERSKRSDEHDLLADARRRGWMTVFTAQELEVAQQLPILGLFAESGMDDAIAAPTSLTQPSLARMTRKALALLSKNPQGFFLMVEAGQIDWAAHANDAGTLLHEMLRADAALKEIVDWIGSREDTLLVVTADHETGGFGFSYHAERIPKAVPFPGTAFSHHIFRPQYNFVEPTVLDLLAGQRRSLYSIAREFDELSLKERTTERLKAVVKDATALDLTTAAATRVLRLTNNQYYVRGHKDLDVPQWTALCAYDAFHPNDRNRFTAALSRELASQLGITWSTGTHTSTPVLAAAYPRGVLRGQGFLNMHELGAALQSVWSREASRSQRRIAWGER